MALGTDHVTLTEAAVFVPEIWSDDVIAAYKANLVMKPLVANLSFEGKKGDTVRIPKPTRGAASAKAAETQVTLIAAVETDDTLVIDQHWHYARLIEDIVKVQALDSMRRFYTDDAGYALAKKVDSFIHGLGALFRTNTASYAGAYIGGDGTTAWSASANANAGNASSLTDEAIRRTIQRLDDNDVPNGNRQWVIPPVEKRKLLGISRFTEQAFTGESGDGNSIRNGLVGNLYGTPVYVSSNCATVADAGAATDQVAVLYFHKDVLVFVEQQAPRFQTQYKLEWLGDLMVADQIFGGDVLRAVNGQALIVPST
jgi:N4-gp56 family major capsid protein